MKSKKFLAQVTALATIASMSANLGGISAFAAQESASGDGVYVLMNIPYDDFYKAEIANEVKVDGVTSATLAKTRGSLVKGSFHVNSDGSDISGVTYPVKVSDLSKLKNYKQVKDEDSVTISVTNRGTTTDTEYKGKDSLFENEKYSYYVLDEAPENYKELSFDANGEPVFSEVKGKEAVAVEDADPQLLSKSRYGDYEIDVEDLSIKDDTVYGVILKAEDGTGYGLRHLENIWKGYKLAWSTGTTTEVHGCPTSWNHYVSMIGKKITEIEYITNTGVYNIKADVEIPEYKYVYAAIPYDEYWKSEGVYAKDNDYSASADEEDASKKAGEYDKGAFDAVTRATTKNSLRATFQNIVYLYDKEGVKFEISHASDDGKTVYTTDAAEYAYDSAAGTLTASDGSVREIAGSEIGGIKYVPVRVNAKDYEDFKSKYDVVENGEKLIGGTTVKTLVGYTYTANATAKTNGVKAAVKQENGSYTFEARSTGTESGLQDVELKKVNADTVKTELVTADKASEYGGFIRLDITEDDEGDLARNIQGVVWDYYGSDSTYSRNGKLVSFGTKFAADNWIKDKNKLQLTLTDSLRAQFPEGTDGTGYWKVTVYALGYQNYTVNVEAKAENIAGVSDYLASWIKKAEKVTADNYTEDSYNTFAAAFEAANSVNKEDTAAVEAVYNDLVSAYKALTVKPVVLSDDSVVLSADSVVYNSKAQTVGVTVKDGDKILTENTDYTVEFKNNTAVGTASVIVTGINAYSGTVSKTFNITAKSISKASVTLASSSYAYDGKAKTPAVSVKDGSVLSKNTDYKVTYKNNVNAGTATVTVTGIGNYSGTVSKTFKITAKSITKPQAVTKIAAKTYTGKQIKPAVNIKVGGKLLKAGTDYTVKYGTNKIGKGTVTIVGKGNYTGKFVRTFTINPRKTTAKLAASKKKFSVTVAKRAEAAKYQIAYSTNAKFKGVKVKTVSSLKTAISAVSKKTYYVKVRTVKTVGKTNYVSGWSAVKKITVK